MPGRNSWNGKWSGEGSVYAIIKPIPKGKPWREKADELLAKRYFSHSWSDGWRASITVTECDGAQARKMRKRSKGFYGYDWMVANILDHGDCRDLTDEEKAASCVQAFEPFALANGSLP